MWAWEREYDDPRVVDGTYFGVTVRWDGRTVTSCGANGFPVAFSVFCEAVSALVGGRRFA